MTAVLCWLNHECNHTFLWAVSDSRISQPNKDVAQPYTDNCPKIFSIPILASKSLEEKKQELYSVGFAYAGSSLVGSTTKDITSRLLGNLVEAKCVDKSRHIPTKSRTPAVFTVAQLIAKVASKYIKEMGQFHTNPSVEIAVYGFCPVNNKYVAYKISRNHEIKCDINFIVSEVLIDSGEILHLGDKKEQITNYIKEIRNEHIKDEVKYSRAPIYALKKIIEDESAIHIGGYCQVNICTPVGIEEFQMFDNNPNYFGFDIEKDLKNLAGYEIDFCALSLAE